MTENTEDLCHAGPLRRLASMLYDGMLLFAVLAAATLIVSLPSLLQGSGPQETINNEQVVHELNPLMTGVAFQLYLLVVAVTFFCACWRKNGQTLGMQAWRLQLQSQTGERISIGQCLLRLAGACISITCLGAGYWWIWIDKNRMSWHDRWSNTRVVLLPKTKK